MPTRTNEHVRPHLYGASLHGDENPGSYPLHETIIDENRRSISKQRTEGKESDDPCQSVALPTYQAPSSRVLYCRSISSSDMSESDGV